MKSGKPLSRRSSLRRKTRVKPVNTKRKAANTARAYGPAARREFVKSLPCSACGRLGYSENAHVLGNGGKSRKADADTIAPLCGSNSPLLGCHRVFDEDRALFRVYCPDYDPAKAAADTEMLWQHHLAKLAVSGTPRRET